PYGACAKAENQTRLLRLALSPENYPAHVCLRWIMKFEAKALFRPFLLAVAIELLHKRADKDK
ncbi:MAG: hypothetical protein NWT00_12030, partial [Beijerinckiaceae bacterium]|nr:hypothetical protein [Beijerinckiaceae bacterium]